MKTCPCDSKLAFAQCCEPYLLDKKKPPTPEALMRSRYTAYAVANEPYLRKTLAPESSSDYDAQAAKKWAEESEWLGLEILGASGDTVEFVAKYKANGEIVEHHELSKFRKDGDQWLFVEGKIQTGELEPIVREGPKTGRNDPCTCGSGKKFKKCCAA